MYVPSSSPHNNRGSRMKRRTGSLNKTGPDGAVWSHIPFILDLIFVERRQQALQRQRTFLQASSDLRLGCPHCTQYTHPHTHRHAHYTFSHSLFSADLSEEIKIACISLSGCQSVWVYFWILRKRHGNMTGLRCGITLSLSVNSSK